MENETEKVKTNPKNMYIPICITQTICITVIIISVLIIKFFFDTTFKKLETWYTDNILTETTITANFDEETSSEI